MSELREQLERLAARGAPGRGADAVVAAAIDAADRGDAWVDQPTRGARSMDDDLEPIDLEDVVVGRPARRGRKPFRALAAAGLAALVGVGVLAVSALTGGGASSAEEAVRKLADAIDAEDPLAAADVLAPSEVRSLRSTLDEASRRAAELELVETASSPLAGIDLSVDDLELDGESLADGFTRVYLRGAIRGSTDVTDFSELVQRAIDDPSGSSDAVDLRDLSPAGIDPFVVAVREDGRWYVSAAYTVLEYIREANDAGPADYGSAVASAAELGAESPEAAARAMVDALAAEDWTRAFSLLPPDEIPVYDYRSVFAELLADTETDFGVDEWSATAAIDGDEALLTVHGSGRFGDGERWELTDECLRMTYTYEGYVDEEFPEYSQDPYTDTTGICLSGSGAFPYSFFFDATGDDSGSVTVRAVRQDGRWFLSPVGTTLDKLDQWVGNFDERSLYTMLDLPEELDAEGTVTVGEPISAEANAAWLMYTYQFAGTEGQRIVGQFATEQSRSETFGSYGDVRIVHADGRTFDEGWSIDGYPVTLPETGEYLIVVQTFAPGPYTLTIWDEADAPAGVVVYGSDAGTIDENGNYCYQPAPGEEVCELVAADPGGGTTVTSIAVPDE
ncbi:MAG TPA: hypothetical protein VFZ83_10145 [Acidimicrobiia bacterium]|nr:hypothetical protein [Acidimicrobiia bacterium]